MRRHQPTMEEGVEGEEGDLGRVRDGEVSEEEREIVERREERSIDSGLGALSANSVRRLR